MPRKNIFVRQEDLPIWDSIEDKPAWLHDALWASRFMKRGQYPATVLDKAVDLGQAIERTDAVASPTPSHITFVPGKTIIKDPVVQPLKIPKTTPEVLAYLKRNPKYTTKDGVTVEPLKPCKHGFDPKFCKFARPGKPCKTL